MVHLENGLIRSNLGLEAVVEALNRIFLDVHEASYPAKIVASSRDEAWLTRDLPRMRTKVRKLFNQQTKMVLTELRTRNDDKQQRNQRSETT